LVSSPMVSKGSAVGGASLIDVWAVSTELACSMVLEGAACAYTMLLRSVES